MKKSIAQKIMILADVLQGIGIACFAWAGVMIIFALIDGDLAQWSKMFVIPLLIGISAYVSNLLVRGYGRLIENTDALRDQADVIIELLSKQEDNQIAELKYCSACQTPQRKTNKFCKKCGMPMDNANEANQ